VGLPLGIVLTLQLAYWVGRSVSGHPAAPVAGATRGLATMLLRGYVLPFELTSILILIAILGAVVLAKKEF
jgi:NADH:ubiquinone oxidoreductase subunit 6 (subunit J)